MWAEGYRVGLWPSGFKAADVGDAKHTGTRSSAASFSARVRTMWRNNLILYYMYVWGFDTQYLFIC